VFHERHPTRLAVAAAVLAVAALALPATAPAAAPPALTVQDGATPADHATTLSLPPGTWSVFATRTLRPLDTRIVDLGCSLVQQTSSGSAIVLDRTVARSQAQLPGGAPAASNAFPRLAFVGVAKDVGASTVTVQCTRGEGVVEPDADVTTITAVKGKSRTARGTGPLAQPASLAVKRDGTYRIDATMTLRPLDTRSGDTTCSLIATSGGASTVLDSTVVRVQAQFDPPPSTSNAFPRLSFTAARGLGAGTLLSVGCANIAAPGYIQPSVDLARVVLTPLGAFQAQTSGGPLNDLVSLPIVSGVRHVVTATATLRPIDAEALDYRCSLLAGSAVLDTTVVRVQGQFDPPPSASNAFPRIAFTGIVQPGVDASGLTVGCVQMGGSPGAAQPTVDLATLTAAQVR
jgi:hypothetical protein